MTSPTPPPTGPSAEAMAKRYEVQAKLGNFFVSDPKDDNRIVALCTRLFDAETIATALHEAITLRAANERLTERNEEYLEYIDAQRKQYDAFAHPYFDHAMALSKCFDELSRDRDALRTRVVELENDKIIIGDKLRIERSYNEVKNQRISALESELAEFREAFSTVKADGSPTEGTTVSLSSLRKCDKEMRNLKRQLTALQTANKALEADKARLDWLEGHSHWHDPEKRVKVIFPIETVLHTTLRSAVDAALATRGTS